MILEVGVKALIQRPDGLYLFIQRLDPLPDGTGIRWDIPGGRIKPEEDLMTALARELKEECSLTFAKQPELVRAQDIFIPGKDRHIVRLTYLLQTDGEVRLGEDHQNFAWKSPENALALQIDKYLAEALRQLVKA